MFHLDFQRVVAGAATVLIYCKSHLPKQMGVMVKRILNRYGYPPDLQDEAVKTVLAQAELLCSEWV